MSRYRNQAIYLGAQALRGLGFNFNEEANEKVEVMRNRILSLRGGINFNIETHPDGSWTAVSTNIDGIVTGGTDLRQTPEMIKDAIFTYFEIPPHLCRPEVLHSDNEAVTVSQTVRIS